MNFISNSVVLNRSDGTARFVKEAPDTITSWVITAFSIDTFHGLGVIEQPTKVCSFFRFLVINFFFGEWNIYHVLFQQLQVFRPFFIQLNLPYSVIRGEIVAIQVVLFNYMNKKIEAELTFENIGDFEFVENGSEDNELSRKYPSKLIYFHVFNNKCWIQ